MEAMIYGSNPTMMGYNPYLNQGMIVPQQGMMQQGMMPQQGMMQGMMPGQMSMMNSPQQHMMNNNQAMMMQMQQKIMMDPQQAAFMGAKQEPGATATPNTGADNSSIISPNMTSAAEAGNVTNNFSPMAAYSNMYGMGSMPMGGNSNKTDADFREFFNGHGMHASAVGGGGTASLGGGNIGQMRGMDDIQHMTFVRQQMMAQNGGTPNNMMPSMGGDEATKKQLTEKRNEMERIKSMMGPNQGLMNPQARSYRGGGDRYNQQLQDTMLQNSQYRSQFKFTPSANQGYNC